MGKWSNDKSKQKAFDALKRVGVTASHPNILNLVDKVVTAKRQMPSPPGKWASTGHRLTTRTR